VKRIVVNGTFDVLHPGHIQLLNYARSLGDYLLVLIDSDRRVQELKGPTRPIFDQQQRRLFLENLKAVDQVKIFDSRDELVALLQEYNADIMVKGGDYQGRSVIGRANCKQVVYFDRIEEYSTTDIIQRILKLHYANSGNQ
jgi:D-beta-D-heptose 7-phosphate kinase/D-beta-D-heptose 1-phosphate adenosyltransferase